MIYTQLYTQKAERYKKVGIAGIVMAVAGGIMLPIGISKYKEGIRGGGCFCSAPPSSVHPTPSAQENIQQGMLLTIAGGAFLGTGITLASIGFTKKEKYEKRIEEEDFPKKKKYEKRIEGEMNFPKKNDEKRIEGLGHNELERYQRKKVVGIVMTVAGGILLGSSYHNAINSGSSSSSSSPDLLVLGGGALLGTGIPLFVSGVKNEKRYHRRVDGLTINLKISPQQSGLMLAYNF